MDLRQLRYFVTLAEERHFQRAAQRLHISQPPLSQQIKRLEQDMGVALFARTTRRVDLTAAGQLFLDRVRPILDQLDQAVIAANGAGRGELGRLAVGITGSATYELLPKLVRAFRGTFPDVQLELQGEMLTHAQMSSLLEGHIDVGFVRPPIGVPELTTEVIRQEPLVALLPVGHPAGSRDLVRLRDLSNEPFVVFSTEQQSRVNRAVWQVCRSAGFTPQVIQEVRETSAMVSFVAAGVGVAIVPVSVQHLHADGTVYRKLDTPTCVELAMCWRADNTSPTLKNFIGFARRVLVDD